MGRVSNSRRASKGRWVYSSPNGSKVGMRLPRDALVGHKLKPDRHTAVWAGFLIPHVSDLGTEGGLK